MTCHLLLCCDEMGVSSLLSIQFHFLLLLDVSFEAGPRIPRARYMDMVDISTSKELFPDRNIKGLFAMLPPKVNKAEWKIITF